MPTSKLTSSKTFLVLLIAVCLVGLAPVAVPDMDPMSCCEAPEVPGQTRDCCEEPEAPPPVEPDCPCATQPEPAPPPAPALTASTAPTWWVDVATIGYPPKVSGTSRPLWDPPRAGAGPPIYRRHCALLI